MTTDRTALEAARDALPPLPESAMLDQFSGASAFTADQMRDYAAQAVTAALAAPQASAPALDDARKSDQQLMRFYSVESLPALIDAQERHIVKLQAKLPPLRDEFPRTPREG